MSLRILLLIFLSASVIYSQNYERVLNPFSVGDQSGVYANIFTGGHNNIEHQFLDIDDDGDYDLFFLDSDGSYGYYKNIGTASSPQFVFSLDSIPGFKIYNWYYFVDIDNDNDFDLFTSGTENFIEFRENTGTSQNPSFTLAIDTLRDNNGDPIFSEFSSNPVFADVDADGDKDFISGNSIGTLTYFENIGTPQSFNFKFISNQWQNIYIVSGGLKENFRHGASALEFGDIDNDSDLDLIWGDFFSRSLYYIQNNGTATNPNLEVVYESYPNNQDSIYTSGFNMSRLIDIDNDSDLDLFVSVLYDPTVPQSLIFLKNNGTPSLPHFQKVTDNYLRTLDAGNTSVPFFTDINSDGDLDLFLGSSKNPFGSLHYFENIGNTLSPNFLLIDSSYFNISGELAIAPAFGDLDGDGDKDLLVGRFDGKIEFYRNTGNAHAANFVFESLLRKQADSTIDIGVYARPELIDYDSDGDLDLIVGRFNGRISFFYNIGNAQFFSFEENYSLFSSIDVGDNSSPFLIDYDSDGDFDLFTGERFGKILHFTNNGTNSNPVWNLTNDKFLNTNFGSDPVPKFVDIDNDSDKDIFIGNVKGGLYFYRNVLVNSIESGNNNFSPDKFSIQSYPNPFNGSAKIKVNVSVEGFYRLIIYNHLGQKVQEIFNGYLTADQHSFNWVTNNNLSSGIYLAVIESINKIKSTKLLLIK